MEDEAIIALFFARESVAIEAAKEKYGRRITRTAHNILRSVQDAEECLNDTLFKAWENIPPTHPQVLGAFLQKIARNLALNRWEAKNAAKRGGGEPGLLLGELAETVPAQTANNPENAYEAARVTESIDAFLQKQDKPSRVVFVLRYFHGESVAAISQRLVVTESKVKSMLFRTRKKLRAHLEKEEVL